MVLDGAVDPALHHRYYVADQADRLESQLRSFFAWCAADGGCPWHPTGDPTASLLDLIRSRPDPTASGDRGAGPGPASCTTPCWPGSGPVRRGRPWPEHWPEPSRATARRPRPWPTATRRGGSTNGADAEEAIDCLDHPVDRDPSSYPALAPRLARSAPVFGPSLAWGLLACATWAVPPTRIPAPASDPGAPPILVVGTTGDPVTPYRWAVDLAKELTGGGSSPGRARAMWPITTARA